MMLTAIAGLILVAGSIGYGIGYIIGLRQGKLEAKFEIARWKARTVEVYVERQDK